MTSTLHPAPASSEIATDAAIDLAGVTRRFGGQTVVDNLSLQVPAGSFMGLIGLNGAGKSTTLRMAVGLLAPNARTIRLAGFDVHKQPVEMKRRVGYVPDRPNIYSWMLGREAIAFVKSFHTTWNQSRCDTLIKRLSIPLDKKVKHLSKGQAAKLQLLLAVCHDPKVLILDEPTSGFDPIVREEFFEGILDFANDQGQTILFSSHALSDVQRLADRVALMHEGKLLLSGTIDGILQRAKRVRVVLEPNAPPPPLPANVIRQQRTGREWVLTIDPFDLDALQAWRTQHALPPFELQDLTLDDLFKDLVRGKAEAAK